MGEGGTHVCARVMMERAREKEMNEHFQRSLETKGKEEGKKGDFKMF